VHRTRSTGTTLLPKVVLKLKFRIIIRPNARGELQLTAARVTTQGLQSRGARLVNVARTKSRPARALDIPRHGPGKKSTSQYFLGGPCFLDRDGFNTHRGRPLAFTATNVLSQIILVNCAAFFAR
jgi:hypothetical protein